MDNSINIFKDEDGFTYRYPERSCKSCLKYPCIPDMDTLLSDFAKYGCFDYYDFNMHIADLEEKKHKNHNGN